MGCNLVKQEEDEENMNITKTSEVIRWNLINSATDEAQLATPGKDVNEQYEGVLKLLKANPVLNNSEKIQAEKNFTFIKDRENLVHLKGPIYPCEQCHRSGYTILFCEHCAREHLENDFVNWTSGNEIIDQAIQQSQIMLPLPRYLIEWIPYTDLEDVKYKTKGGCAEILTATWKKGVVLSFDNKEQEFQRSPAGIVVLKRLTNSRNADAKFLMELKVHILLGSRGYTVATCYGVTRDPSTEDYVLVLANYEQDFGSYIKNSYNSITWKDVYNIFYNISEDLYNMHKENIIHRDLHSKNILKSAGGLFNLSDFGICGPANMGSSNIYGNLPFIAPEIFLKQPYTTASDIYSMGMLMYHATVGFPPFADCHHDLILISEITAGIRPPIPDGLPPSFEALMMQCWTSDPSERPSAEDLYYYFLDEYEAALQDPELGSILVKECITSQIPRGDIHGSQSATLVHDKNKIDEIQTQHIYEIQGDTLVCENIETRMWKIEDIPKSPIVEHFVETQKDVKKVSNVVWRKPDRHKVRKKPTLIKKGHLVLLKPPVKTN